MKIFKNSKYTLKTRMLLFIIIILMMPAFTATSENLRNITSVSFAWYFDETYRLDTQDVLLVRIKPWLTFKADIERIDTEGFYAFIFGIGPVINFTKTFYLDSLFGIGITSNGDLSQKVDISLAQDSDLSSVSIGCKGIFYQTNDYFYILPSISGVICPVEQLRLFCKLFFSWDRDNVITGSFWGDVAWSFTKLFSANTGFTISYAEGLGYAIIGGIKFTFSENFNLKYQIKFLSNTIEFIDSPQIKYGIDNGIIVDFRF